MRQAIDLSVVILSFNTKALLRSCLASVYASRLNRYEMEVIVCDNASTDGSVPMVEAQYPKTIIIRNRRNVGFAAGNNPGLRRAGGRYVLLLNSDTEVNPDVFTAMIAFMDGQPQAGAATCKLVLADGTMDPACHRGFPTPWAAFTYYSGLERLFPKSRVFGGYHLGFLDLTTDHEVEVISGAFFMVRRQVLATVGVLDERYFMYAEDIDWSWRIKKAGWKIMYHPQVQVLHRKKQSGRVHASRALRAKTERYFYDSNRRFYNLHLAKRYAAPVTWLVNGAADIRIFFLDHFSR